MSTSTQTVIEHHLKALDENIEAIMIDYTEDSVLITPDATLRGLTEIQTFFTALVEWIPEGFWDSFTIKHQEFVDEVGYILWEADPWFPFSTDTFVVRNGIILFQTVAGIKAE